MTKEEAIKFLQQIYPNGGHCWLDEQRIEAISMAIKALQEEPVKIKKGCKYRCLSDMVNRDTGNISFIGDKIYLAPEDDTLVSEENGWLCDTSENASNFELVEEPVSEPQVKESLISIHDDKTCKENDNSLTQEPTIPDIVDEHFYEMLGLEPVSNPIDFEQELYKAFGQVKDFTLGMQIAKWFYDMGRNYQEPVSEELEEASKEWLRPQLDKSYANYGEVKMMELTHFDGYAMLDAIEFGVKWQKEKMMAKAIDGVVTFDYYDSGDKTYGCIAHDSFCLEDLGLKDTDKVRMILIKED